MKTLKKILHAIWHQIWTIFLNGLLTILPFALTIVILTFAFRLIYGWFEPLYRLEPAFLRSIPGSHIGIAVAGVFFVGLVIKLFLLEPLIHSIEKIFFKIPLMRPVYGGIKQLVQAFTIQDEMAFQKVVLIPFPSSKTYSLGFLTSEVPPGIIDGDAIYFNVFVPTTPNPTSGFLVQVPQEDIKEIQLTRQEAMSLIISGGIIQPDRFTTQ